MLRLFKVSTSTSKSKKLALLKLMSILCYSNDMSFLGIDVIWVLILVHFLVKIMASFLLYWLAKLHKRPYKSHQLIIQVRVLLLSCNTYNFLPRPD